MAPVLTCPEDVSVMVDPDGTHTVADYIGSGAATATDNCTLQLHKKIHRSLAHFAYPAS